MADDGHLGAVHPQGDLLPGELVADVDLAACQAARPVALTIRSTSMAGPVPDGSGEGPAGRAPSAARRASSTAEPGGQRLQPGAVQQDMQDCLIDPDGDLTAGQRRAEPDLLAADLQVPDGGTILSASSARAGAAGGGCGI